MALQYVGGKSGSFVGATSGNTNVALNSGLTGGIASAAAAGDLVVVVFVTGSTANRALAITDPSAVDYTLIDSELYANGSTYDTNLRAAYKFMPGTPDASVNIGPSGNAADGAAYAIHVWRGVDTSNPFDVAPVAATGTGTGRPNAGAVRRNARGSVVLVAGGGAAATGAVFTASELSGFVTANGADTNDGTVGLGYYDGPVRLFDPAAWTGGSTNAANSWAALSLVLRPAAQAQYVAGSPAVAWGMKRLVSGYSGYLFRIKRTNGDTLDVSCASGSDLPDYAAIRAWEGTETVFKIVLMYDQSGNARNSNAPASGEEPDLDLNHKHSGCCPMLFVSDRTGAFGSPGVRRVAIGHTADAYSINRQSFSAFDVLDPMTSCADNTHWEAHDTAGANLIAMAGSEGSPGMVVVGNVGYESGLRPRAMPMVIGMTNDAATMTLYVGEAIYTNAGLTSATCTRSMLGNLNQPSSYYHRARRFAHVVYGSTLTRSEAQELRATLVEMFDLPTMFYRRVVFSGDSIIEGYGYGANFHLSNTPVQLQRENRLRNVEIYNCGINGINLTNDQARYALHVQPLYSAQFGANNCISMSDSGHNDIGAGTAAATVNSSRASAITTLKGYGYRVGWATCLRSNGWPDGSGEETVRVSVNSNILAKTQGEDFTVDPDSDPILSLYSTTSNTTYFIDQDHPTDEGHRLIAPYYARQLAIAASGPFFRRAIRFATRGR